MNANVIMTDASESTVLAYFAWLDNCNVSFAPLQGFNDASAAMHHLALLLDDSAIDVTWAEVVYGCLMYEAFSCGHSVLSTSCGSWHLW
jgi:hypothetical protein